MYICKYNMILNCYKYSMLYYNVKYVYLNAIDCRLSMYDLPCFHLSLPLFISYPCSIAIH